MGALFGECLVIINAELKTDFRYHIKQKGAMLAKGRLLGVQFDALFEGDLYLEIGKHENECANILKEGLKKMVTQCILKVHQINYFQSLIMKRCKKFIKNISQHQCLKSMKIIPVFALLHHGQPLKKYVMNL